MHKIKHLGGLLGTLLGPLLKTDLPFMKNVIKTLAKSSSIPLGLIAASSVTDAAIHKKMFGSGTRPSDLVKQTTVIISNEEINDIMKIVKSLEESSLLIKDVSETVKNEAKEQKGGLLSMLLGTLGVSLLGNLIARKSAIIAGEGTFRAVQNF